MSSAPIPLHPPAPSAMDRPRPGRAARTDGAPEIPMLLWLLVGQVIDADQTRCAPVTMGLFSSPEGARETARLHPDLRLKKRNWRRVGWNSGREAYRTRAESEVEGETETWELWVIPFAVDEPVFDYHEDRERFEARLPTQGQQAAG